MSLEGKKVRKLFKKYGLDIYRFEERDFLSPHHLFPYEKKCKEVRVHLGSICTLEWLEDLYGLKSLEEYDKENENCKFLDPKKRREEFIKDLNCTEKKLVREIDESLTFSIFIKFDENGDDRHLSIKKEKDILYAFESAYFYMSFLMSCAPKVYGKGYGDDIFLDDIESFKEILEFSDIQINNTNIEIIPEISYRIYKDHKFFYELSDYLKIETFEQFINDFEHIINNPE